MTTYDYLGGGLTVRPEFATAMASVVDNATHYLTGTNISIQAHEFCSIAHIPGLSGTVDGQMLICGSYYNTLGYLPGSSGAGILVWKSTLAKSNHNGVTVFSPTVPWTGTQATLADYHAGTGETDASGLGCWVREYQELYFEMGGAIGDDSTNDWRALQSVFNVNSSLSTVKIVKGSPGRIYRHNDTLTIDTSKMYFDGQYSTLKLNDATGLKNNITYGNGTTSRSSLKFKNVVLSRVQAATAGYALECNFVGVTEITDIYIFGNNFIYNGIKLYRATRTTLFGDNFIESVVNNGMYLAGSGTSGANKTIDTKILGITIANGTNCIECYDFVEGFYLADSILWSASNIGLKIDASSNANGLSSFKMMGTDFDTCTVHGIYIDKVSNAKITDSWFGNSNASDIYVGVECTSLIIATCDFTPTTRGIETHGTTVNIFGNSIYGNSATSCIKVASDSNKTKVRGNILQGAQYAIERDSPPNFTFEGNELSSFSIGTFNGSAGTSNIVRNNTGDSVVGTTAFVSAGASPYTYTAGVRPETIILKGGTVSSVAMSGLTVATASPCTVNLAPNASVIITYAAAPSIYATYL